jgi:alcohol dehydrogenase class IV
MAALITTPRLLSIGGGALGELPALLARLGLSRPLIVTDPFIAKSGILDKATGLLDGAGMGGVPGHRLRPDDRNHRRRGRAAARGTL